MLLILIFIWIQADLIKVHGVKQYVRMHVKHFNIEIMLYIACSCVKLICLNQVKYFKIPLVKYKCKCLLIFIIIIFHFFSFRFRYIRFGVENELNTFQFYGWAQVTVLVWSFACSPHFRIIFLLKMNEWMIQLKKYIIMGNHVWAFP